MVIAARFHSPLVSHNINQGFAIDYGHPIHFTLMSQGNVCLEADLDDQKAKA